MVIGATLTTQDGKNGCYFRVWAPNVTHVSVVGDFNNWSDGVHLLTRSSDGYWAGFVADVVAGERYKYFMVTVYPVLSKSRFEQDLLSNLNGPDRVDMKHSYSFDRKRDVYTLVASTDMTHLVELYKKAQFQEFYRFDPAARDTKNSTIDSSNYGIVVDPGYQWSAFIPPHFADMVIYECHIGTFAGLNDGLDKPNRVATFQDVEQKLSYIRDMGFNVVSLLPVFEFPRDHSWGYDICFYFTPEAAYGSPADLRHFVNTAHELGLAVIFDVVYHTTSAQDSVFWQYDVDFTEHNSIYWSGYHTPWGPAPCFDNTAVCEFFLDNAIMYLREYNGDGLRFDATRLLETNTGTHNSGWQFMQLMTYTLRQMFPGKYLVAEHYPTHDSIVYQAGFDGTWQPSAAPQMRAILNGDNIIPRLSQLVVLEQGLGQHYPNPWSLVKAFTGSHDDCGRMLLWRDEPWVLTRDYLIATLGGRDNWYARAKVRLAWLLNVACVGLPMMFMGTECLMPDFWADYVDTNSIDHRFNWLYTEDLYGQQMRRLVTHANGVRYMNPALRTKNIEITHTDYNNSVLAFKRWNNEGNIVLTVVNASDTNFQHHCYGIRTGNVFGRWSQLICSQDATYGGWDGAGNADYEPVTTETGSIYINLPQWSVVILRWRS